MAKASEGATARLVAGIFELSPRDWAIIQRRRRRTGILLTVGMALAALAMLTLASGDVVAAIQHGTWDEYWHNVPGTLQFLMIVPFFAVILLAPLAPLLGVGDALRAAAARGDAAQAPEAAMQPEPLLPSELPIGVERIGPLLGQRDGMRSAGMGIGIAGGTIGALLIGVLVGVVTPWLIAHLQAGPQPPAWITAVFIGGTIFTGAMALVCAGMAVYCAIWLRRLRRGIVVVADEWGLQWRDTRWRTGDRRIAWHEVTSFITITYSRRGGGYQRVYALDAGDATTLSWTVTDARGKYAAAAGERLSRLAVTRGRLPLRDLSAAVREAASVLRALGKRDAPAAADPSLPQAFRDALAGAARLSRRTGMRFGRAVLIGEAVILALLYPGAWAAQHYQAHSYETLLARVHAAPPLFQDTLASDDGQWPVQAGDGAHPGRSVYTAGAYQLSGVSEDDVEAWTEATYADAAVQVTASQQGWASDDGVGLILRVADGGQRMMAFFASPAGTWSLWRYETIDGAGTWTALADQIDNGAIHGSAGSQNTLTVIMRGAEYICYINGSFVGVYQDGALAAGHVGVFVNDGATTGSFSNFAVYPL